MFLHISNLCHLMAFVIYLLLLGLLARNPRGKTIRTVSTLIEMGVVLLCIDILIGFLAIVVLVLGALVGIVLELV